MSLLNFHTEIMSPPCFHTETRSRIILFILSEIQPINLLFLTADFRVDGEEENNLMRSFLIEDIFNYITNSFGLLIRNFQKSEKWGAKISLLPVVVSWPFLSKKSANIKQRKKVLKVRK